MSFCYEINCLNLNTFIVFYYGTQHVYNPEFFRLYIPFWLCDPEKYQALFLAKFNYFIPGLINSRPVSPISKIHQHIDSDNNTILMPNF